MSFQEVLAVLPKLTPEQRDLLRVRLAGFENGSLVEERGGEYFGQPAALHLDRIIREIRQLPRGLTAELLDRLLVDAVVAPDPEADAAWRDEVRRRVADIESGREPGIDGDEVMAELRKIVGR